MTREELRDYVEEQRSLKNIPYHVYSTLIDGIDTLEQEPRKGHWIKTELPSREGHVCSECGNSALIDECGNEQLTDFCPHCGVDMREVEE